MEKIVEQGILYDFYGELLNEHQRKIYEDAIYRDFSLSEIAEEEGISRQGVHDMIRRCSSALEEYESKLHLVERFGMIKQNVNRMNELIGTDIAGHTSLKNEIKMLSDRIMEAL